jgi:hypothetical protein
MGKLWPGEGNLSPRTRAKGPANMKERERERDRETERQRDRETEEEEEKKGERRRKGERHRGIVKRTIPSWCQRLMPIILATQEAEIKRIMVRSQHGKQFERPYFEKTHHKKELVEWLKV